MGGEKKKGGWGGVIATTGKQTKQAGPHRNKGGFPEKHQDDPVGTRKNEQRQHKKIPHNYRDGTRKGQA